MSFHTLNYPSHVFGSVNNHNIKYKIRKNSSVSITAPLILLQADESGNLLDSKRSFALNRPSKNSGSSGPSIFPSNTVGIIGGVSADSTLNFLKKLTRWSSKDGEDCPPFVICSDPMLSKELLSHQRSYRSSLASGNEHFHSDHAPIVKNLTWKRAFLENSGARCIVMPCHTLHTWHDEVSKGCSVPFLHVGECVAMELKNAKLKPPEAGSPIRIGVLAPDATLSAGFYQEKLQNEGFEVVLPDKATMEHAVIPATEAISRKDLEGARNLLQIALQVLLLRAVNTVIVASDDMRDLLPQDDHLLTNCIDPMDALARSTIKWAQSAEKIT